MCYLRDFQNFKYISVPKAAYTHGDLGSSFFVCVQRLTNQVRDEHYLPLSWQIFVQFVKPFACVQMTRTIVRHFICGFCFFLMLFSKLTSKEKLTLSLSLKVFNATVETIVTKLCRYPTLLKSQNSNQIKAALRFVLQAVKYFKHNALLMEVQSNIQSRFLLEKIPKQIRQKEGNSDACGIVCSLNISNVVCILRLGNTALETLTQNILVFSPLRCVPFTRCQNVL